jgi:DNA-binding NtrC family response regulator
VWLNPAFSLPEEGFKLDETIQQWIEMALKATGNNVSAAARRLGVTRDYMRYRLTDRRTPGAPDRDVEVAGGEGSGE